MKKNHKIFATIFVFFLVLFALSWKNMYKNVLILTNFEKNLPENRYNQALKMAKNGDFSRAMEMLPEQMEYFPERLFELRGDILYAQKAEKQHIIAEYEKSLEIAENPRIREKIQWIREENFSEKITKNADNSEQFSEEILQAREQILQDQKNREQYIDPYNSSQNFQKDVQLMKNLLETNNFSEQKDW